MPCCCAVPVSTLPCNPCHVKNATSAQRGKEKKKAKYDDSLQELRKNKKELEFEQKLYKEKEEMLEKEKQLKINRLAQEVSETEREDLEESEKIQYWVERLCQTRLEQISSADDEIAEITTVLLPPPPSVSPLVPPLRRFAGTTPVPPAVLGSRKSGQGCCFPRKKHHPTPSSRRSSPTCMCGHPACVWLLLMLKCCIGW